jgi:Leucine-rich repeat (LRR) protein
MKQVTSVSGLQAFTGLTSLNLPNNRVTDVSPLAGLTGLTWLSLSGIGGASDASPLAGLTGLTHLDLESNRFDDLSMLAGLTNLTYLDLTNNNLSDVSMLAGLTNLTRLDLDLNYYLEDVSPLAGLTNLTHLDLGFIDYLIDVSPLSGLTSLTHLDLSCSPVGDVSPLAELTGLTSLYLSKAGLNPSLPSQLFVSDVSPLAGMTGLTDLDLSYNRVSDVSLLAGLTSLTNLYLNDNQLGDVSPLASLPGLWYLDLAGNQLGDVSMLAGLTGLRYLYLSRNQVDDMSPLGGLTASVYATSQSIVLPSRAFETAYPLPVVTSRDGSHPVLAISGGEYVIDESAGTIAFSGSGEYQLTWNDGSSFSGAMTTEVIAANPVTIESVTVAGTTRVGGSVSAIVGTVTPSDATLSYQWYRNGTAIIGATDSSYTLVAADSGQPIKVTVTASKAGYATTWMTSDTVPGNAVYIPDANLRACLNWNLGRPSDATVYLSQTSSIINLDCREKGIASTTGLEAFGNLASVHLERNQISDLSPLADLTHLDWLNLSSNQISDVSPLAGLTNLTYLSLSSNQVSDVSPLAGLTNLTSLIVSSNQISDMSPLADLTNLVYLYPNSQSVVLPSGVVGLAYPLPVVTARDGSHPLLSVSGGGYVIDESAGTITFSDSAAYKFTWGAYANFNFNGTMTVDVEPGTITIASVEVSGTTKVGDEVSADVGTISPDGTTVSYQWLRVGEPIAGATNSTYTLTTKDVCLQLSVRVTVSKSGYTDAVVMSPVVAAPVFTDVPSSHTFYSPICWIAQTGVTVGTGSGMYSPSDPVNRGSIAAFLYRMAGSPAWTPPATSPFVDVPKNHKFYREITWLAASRITVGVVIAGKTYYQPDNALNRGSMSAFLYRLSGSPSYTAPATAKFADTPKTHTFYKTISWLASKNITAGSMVGGQLLFQPSNPVNRGSMAAFLDRLANQHLQCTKYPNGIQCTA